MQRPKRPKQSRRSPYPARGSTAGDMSVGGCHGDSCDRQLYRGDIFFTDATGRLLCVDCWEKVPGVEAAMHRAFFKPALEELAKQRHAEMDAGFPAFTRQKWDDMHEHTRDAFRLRALDELDPAPTEMVWDGEFPE